MTLSRAGDSAPWDFQLRAAFARHLSGLQLEIAKGEAAGLSREIHGHLRNMI
jgi:hypothetical protein